MNVLEVLVEVCEPLLESVFEFEAVEGGRGEAGSAGLERGSACVGELSTSSDRFRSMLISSKLRKSPFEVCRIIVHRTVL